MPFCLTESLKGLSLHSLLRGEAVVIAPSSSHIRVLQRRLLKETDIIWGDIFFTPETLIKKLSDPLQPPIGRTLERAIVYDLLARTELRYFERVKTEQRIGDEFFRAISALRSNLISSDSLERELTERGSLKENDLLNIYKRYEEVLDRYNLSDAGAQLEDAVSRVKDADLPERMIVHDFELIPRGLALLLKKIAECRPETTIDIVRRCIPKSAIYQKYFTAIESNLSGLGLSHPARGVDEGKWKIPSRVELHTCRTIGDECRFISREISRLISGGAEPADIGLVSPTAREYLAPLLSSMNDLGLVPDEALLLHEGRLNPIRMAILRARSLSELVPKLEEAFSKRLKDSFRNGIRIPQVPSNLRLLQEIFNDLFVIGGIKELRLDDEIVKRCALRATFSDPRRGVDTEGVPFDFTWWGCGFYPEAKALFIPSFYQGGIPPLESASLFFQETAFLPGNAPSFFSELFPQSDMLRSRNTYRLRKYLEGAASKAILTLPRIGTGGKETFASSQSALFYHEALDEPEVPHPEDGDECASSSISRRLKSWASDRERVENNASVISEEEIKADIKKRFDGVTFSPTQLERYAQCPYHYYLERVLKLEPIELPTPEIKPKDRGTIIHHILELFYRSETENLLRFMRREIEFSELESRLDKYCGESLKKHRDLVKEAHPSLVEHFARRARALCRNAILKEIELIDRMQFPLEPRFTEWEFGLNGKPPMALNDSKISGKIDRIDVDEEHKTFTITDYKSGETNAVIGKTTKGKHLQLPLYIEAVRRLLLKDKKCVGAFLFSMRVMDKKHGIARKDYKSFYFKGMNPKLFVDDEAWNELIGAALKNASNYIDAIRRSEFKEDTGGCRNFCDFKEVCRYGE